MNLPENFVSKDDRLYSPAVQLDEEKTVEVYIKPEGTDIGLDIVPEDEFDYYSFAYALMTLGAAEELYKYLGILIDIQKGDDLSLLIRV
jgi:hypothetical protein